MVPKRKKQNNKKMECGKKGKGSKDSVEVIKGLLKKEDGQVGLQQMGRCESNER
jgi:hypothetical protein